MVKPSRQSVEDGGWRVAQSEARAQLSMTVREKIEAVESKGFSYEGPSLGELSDMVEDVVALIVDKVKGR